MPYFVYIKDILGIETNLSSFGWIYGRVAPETDRSEFERCKIRINLNVGKTDDVFDKSLEIDKLDKYNYFYAVKGEKKIYYERNIFFNLKLRYSIEIHDNSINIIANKNYYKFIKYKFMNLHSLDYILSDIATSMLLLNGYATLHCSSVKIGEKTMVFFAPPGTGKTITVINLCRNNNAKFISEDIAITDGNDIYSIPWTSTFGFYNHDKESKVDRLVDSLKKTIPLLQLMKIKKEKSYKSYLENIQSEEISNITEIILLGRGKADVIKTKEGMFESIINLNKYEFNYHRSPSLLVMNYFNPEISTDKMYETEKRLFNKMLDNSNSYKIFAMNALDYSEIINDNLI